MNDPNWRAAAFTDLVQRFRDLGINAEPPAPGESPDAYVARLFLWTLEVIKGQPRYPVTDVSVLTDRAGYRLHQGFGRLENPDGRKANITGMIAPEGK